MTLQQVIKADQIIKDNKKMNMTREIKFRVWDKIMEDIAPLVELHSDWVAIPIMDEEGGHLEKRKIEDVYLMQFTGLLDKNGKEIYEGDIVKSIEARGDELGDYTEELKQEVFFDGCAFYPVCTAPSENWEVIGNIY